MIKLDAAFITTDTTTMGEVTQVTATDTLQVSSVTIDLRAGELHATVLRGTLDQMGTFKPTMASLEILVKADGSFVSTDGSWSGAVAAAPALVAQLKATFDQFILLSGSVTGKGL